MACWRGRASSSRPLRRGGRLAVVSDQTVATRHGPALEQALAKAGLAAEAITYPPGEQTKSFEVLADLCDRLLGAGLDRSSLVVALGGGVIGDLAGFAAAITMRGMGFIQVPTTLLAQVDSSVGGKTAVDTARGKNLVGAFHQPRLVLADLDVLSTLPERQMRAGFGEVLKYGLIGDAGFFGCLESDSRAVLAREPTALEHAVAQSIRMKADIVARDERELTGARALLNLGHTFGHALEAEAGFGEALLHGEAVALGCAMAFPLLGRARPVRRRSCPARRARAWRGGPARPSCGDGPAEPISRCPARPHEGRQEG